MGPYYLLVKSSYRLNYLGALRKNHENQKPLILGLCAVR